MRGFFFQRLTAGVFKADPHGWLLKGGQALLVRYPAGARLSKDIDLQHLSGDKGEALAALISRPWRRTHSQMRLNRSGRPTSPRASAFVCVRPTPILDRPCRRWSPPHARWESCPDQAVKAKPCSGGRSSASRLSTSVGVARGGEATPGRAASPGSDRRVGPGRSGGKFVCFGGQRRVMVARMNVTGPSTTATARATSSPVAAA
ncbi:nucleotidyl transferase AbiEii/AbiGii toxin family protein [Streptomyces sp. NBC_00390]|uniref:nucleotidyl transferase AbiEii/AbiGii toxin family protein n=1 Tax=Streptomyces sp. NBC_00390 TaxID=2975736 RepID=UPI002E1E915F